MAFCAYCGKQLEEGQVCDCAESKAAAQATNMWQAQQNVNPQSNMNQQMYQQAPNQYYGQTSEQARQAAAAASQAATQAASKAGNILNETFGHLLLILKTPATAGKNFVIAANVKVSCALILLQGIVAGLFSLLIANKINALASSIGSGVAGLFGGSSSVSLEIFSKGKAFLFTLLMSIVFALVYALLSWAVTAISKGKTTYQQMLSVAGVRASFALPITVISIILFFINPIVSFGVFFIGGTFLAMTVQMEALNGVMGINNNIKTYFVAIAMIIFCGIAIYLTFKVAPQTISSYYLKMIGSFDMQDILEEIMDALNYM